MHRPLDHSFSFECRRDCSIGEYDRQKPGGELESSRDLDDLPANSLKLTDHIRHCGSRRCRPVADRGIFLLDYGKKPALNLLQNSGWGNQRFRLLAKSRADLFFKSVHVHPLVDYYLQLLAPLSSTFPRLNEVPQTFRSRERSSCFLAAALSARNHPRAGRPCGGGR